MAEVRMSLQQAAELLGVAPNSVRSRWKTDKIKGERDNTGKIWVWLDPEAANDEGSKTDASNPSIEGFESPPSKGSKKRVSKGSIEGSKDFEIKALQDHLKTALEQLAIANVELAGLRPMAGTVERLEAEKAGLQAQLDMRAEQLAELRQLLADAKQSHAEELARFLEQERAKGFFARLFGR